MTDFTPPPAGMLSEQIDLPDHEMTLGLIHGGEGLRIVVWDGHLFRHLTEDAAIKYAQEIESWGHAMLLAPASDALRTLAAKVNEIETAAMFRRAGRAVFGAMAQDYERKLMDMPVEGRA